MPHAHTDSTDTFLANAAEDVRTRLKLEGGQRLRMASDFEPAGDQPTAIRELSAGVMAGDRDQVLLGATGTGKTRIFRQLL